MKIETKFDINQTIEIKPLNIKGTIKGISLNSCEISYRVKYYLNSEQKIEWFDEVELIESTTNKIGFND